jgi:hypothetical protein
MFVLNRWNTGMPTAWLPLREATPHSSDDASARFRRLNLGAAFRHCQLIDGHLVRVAVECEFEAVRQERL